MTNSPADRKERMEDARAVVSQAGSTLDSREGFAVFLTTVAPRNRGAVGRLSFTDEIRAQGAAAVWNQMLDAIDSVGREKIDLTATYYLMGARLETFGVRRYAASTIGTHARKGVRLR